MRRSLTRRIDAMEHLRSRVTVDAGNFRVIMRKGEAGEWYDSKTNEPVSDEEIAELHGDGTGPLRAILVTVQHPDHE